MDWPCVKPPPSQEPLDGTHPMAHDFTEEREGTTTQSVKTYCKSAVPEREPPAYQTCRLHKHSTGPRGGGRGGGGGGHVVSQGDLGSRWQGALEGGGGGWHKASASGCLPLAAPIGLSPLLIPTLCGSKRRLVGSTEPPDDLFCLTTPGVGRPVDQVHPDAHPESMWGFANSSTDL